MVTAKTPLIVCVYFKYLHYREEALRQFKIVQEGHSKVRGILYSKLEPQTYLNNKLFSNKECELLFGLRSNSLRGVKANTSSIFDNKMSCPLKWYHTNNEDNQQHLLHCNSIHRELTIVEVAEVEQIQYCDVYSLIQKQKAAIIEFTKHLEVREVLLERSCSTPTPTSGSSLDTATRACQGGDGD